MGVCENGVANGSGVGVIVNSDGSAVEYYGNALNGRAHGPGYMIMHGSNGSYALEGNFTSGKASGAMRVSKAGETDKVRNYVDGRDSGTAASGAIVATPFRSTRPGI